MPNEIAISESAQVKSKKMVESGNLVIEIMHLKIKLQEYEQRISKLESNPQETLVSSSEDVYVIVAEDDPGVHLIIGTYTDESTLEKVRKRIPHMSGKCRIARLVFLEEKK